MQPISLVRYVSSNKFFKQLHICEIWILTGLLYRAVVRNRWNNTQKICLAPELTNINIQWSADITTAPNLITAATSILTIRLLVQHLSSRCFSFLYYLSYCNWSTCLLHPLPPFIIFYVPGFVCWYKIHQWVPSKYILI